MAHGETKEPRSRNFAFVQLVENLPDDWRDVAEDLLIPMAYIVHDKDVYSVKEEQENPEHKAGTPKKPHVHFFAYFSGKKTVSGVLKLFSKFNVSYVESVQNKNAYLAYMLHIGKEDKHRYDYDELVILNGLKVNFADLSNVDFGDVLQFADEYNISKFSELVRATRVKDPALFRYCQGHYALCCAFFADERE